METNIFNRLIRDHSLPFVPALDPFRLSQGDLVARLQALEALGATVAFLASTDDELYDSVVPNLLPKLRAATGITVLEHFRPKRGLGFRRSSADGAVLMTRVLTSDDDFYRNCQTVEGIGETSTLSAQERYDAGLFASGAIVFGNDQKSGQYVAARPLSNDVTEFLDADFLKAADNLDVLYLFSRNLRLDCGTIGSVRNKVGDHIPIIASGCIRSSDDIRSLHAAGATQTVIGSLLEDSMWRECVADLSRATIGAA
jgi:heptaprenylglyceryl phosphate synthase